MRWYWTCPEQLEASGIYVLLLASWYECMKWHIETRAKNGIHGHGLWLLSVECIFIMLSWFGMPNLVPCRMRCYVLQRTRQKGKAVKLNWFCWCYMAVMSRSTEPFAKHESRLNSMKRKMVTIEEWLNISCICNFFRAPSFFLGNC